MSKILFIDAGHGSLDANGTYTTPPHKGKWFDHKKGKFHKGSIFYEGVWNRSFAAKFIEMATQVGFHCVPVYDPIQDTLLGKRVENANIYSKEVVGGKGVYLSFHSNASGAGTARGFNLFYHPKSPKGKKLATEIVADIQSVFVKQGSKSYQPLREGYMDEKKEDIYYVLEATTMPSLLFEFGFFDNYEDASLIFTEAFQCDLALQLVNTLSKATLY
jgi:N-acetylmuramoyl-L-alanine amidase